MKIQAEEEEGLLCVLRLREEAFRDKVQSALAQIDSLLEEGGESQQLEELRKKKHLLQLRQSAEEVEISRLVTQAKADSLRRRLLIDEQFTQLEKVPS